MQAELSLSHPELNISIAAINEFGQDSANATASAGRTLPLLQDVNNDGQAGSDTWTSWNGAWRDVVILDATNRRFATFSLNPDQQDLSKPDNYEALKQMLIAAASANNVAAPTSVDLLAASDTGVSNSDNITQKNNSLPANSLQFRVSGVESGALVKLYYNSTLVGQATATGTTVDITTNGSTTIGEGAASFTATQDVGGSTSAASAALSVTIDTLAPGTITPAFPSQASVGTAVSYNAQNAEEGQSGFRYSLASAPSGMSIDQSTGTLTWTPTSAQAGTQNFTIQATDAAGNVRTLAATVNVAGGAPTAVDLDGTSDAGFSSTDNLTNATLPKFNISGVTSGAIIKLYTGATLIGQGTATGTTISITATTALAEGTHGITASQTIGGVESAKSPALSVTIDTTGPGFFVSSPAGQANVGVLYTFNMQHGEEGQTGFRYSLVSPPTGMSIDELTGVITWTPTAAQAGPHPYQVRGADAAGNARTVNATITVVSGAPTGIALAAGSDTGFSDSDRITNNAQPQLSMTGLTAGATIRVYDGNTLLGTLVAASATATFTPSAPLSQGVHSLSASQVVGGTESDRTLPISVTIDTTAPAAITPTPPTTVLAGVAFSYNAQNAEEGQTGFRYSLSAAPTGMTINETTGVVAWTPTAAQAGARSFEIRATDAAGNVSTLPVSLTVLGPLPGVADTFAATEDTPLSVVAANGVLANDGDGQSGALSATLLTNVAHGTLALNANGSFTYTPTTNYFGPDSFTYQAGDGTRTTSPVTVTINVAAVNDAPVATGDSYAITAGSPLNVSAANGVLKNDTDVDSTTLSAELVSGPANGTLTLNADGSFTYTSTAGFSGSDTFTYRVSDGAATSNTATVTIGVNAPPQAVADAYTVNEDQTLTVASASGVLANDTDAESDPLTAELVTGPTHGTLTLNPNGSFTYTPTANYNGPDSFTYRARDAQQPSQTVLVTLTVNAVNDAPTAVGEQYGVDIGAVLTVNAANGVLANDTDVEGSPLSAVVASQPAHGSLALGADGSFTYTPTAGFSGSDTFSYRADDGDDLSTPATVTITVNGAPTVQNDTYSATEDLPLVVMAASGVLANDSDAEGDPLTAAVVDGPANGTVTLNANGSFTYTPNANFSGTDSFTYRASDGNVSSTEATVTINVAGVNDAPIASGDSAETDEDMPLTIGASGGVLANDQDIEGSPLSAVLVSGPTHGTLTLAADGSFTYTPSANFHGADAFTYRALDGSLSSAPATVTITVRPVADPPVILPVANRTIFTGGTLVVDVDAADIDGTNATMAYAIVIGPAGATIDPATGVVTWTAPSDAAGRFPFTVSATKGTSDALSSTVDFNVDVSPLGGLIADAIAASRRVLAFPPGTPVGGRPLRGTMPDGPRNGGYPTGGNGTLSIPTSSLSRLQSGGRTRSRDNSQGTENKSNGQPSTVTPASGTEKKENGAAVPASGGGSGTTARRPRDTDTGFVPDATPKSDEALASLDVSAGQRVVARFVRELTAQHESHSASKRNDSAALRRLRFGGQIAGDELAALAKGVAERTATTVAPTADVSRADDAAPADANSNTEAEPSSDLRKAFAAAAVATSAFAPMLVTQIRRRRRPDSFAVRRPTRR
ncbi:MAG: Ig-like domain-containing protein [Pirellulales bacterium]